MVQLQPPRALQLLLQPLLQPRQLPVEMQAIPLQRCSPLL